MESDIEEFSEQNRELIGYFHQVSYFLWVFFGFFIPMSFFLKPWVILPSISGNFSPLVFYFNLSLKICLFFLCSSIFLRYMTKYRARKNPVFLNIFIIYFFFTIHYLSVLIRDLFTLMSISSIFWAFSIHFSLLFAMIFNIILFLYLEIPNSRNKWKKDALICLWVFIFSYLCVTVLIIIGFLEQELLLDLLYLVLLLVFIAFMCIYPSLRLFQHRYQKITNNNLGQHSSDFQEDPKRDLVEEEKKHTYPSRYYLFSLVFGLALVFQELILWKNAQKQDWIGIAVCFLLLFGHVLHQERFKILQPFADEFWTPHSTGFFQLGLD